MFSKITRIVSFALCFSFLFLLSCDEESSGDEPRSSFELGYEFRASGYTFFVQSLVKSDRYLLSSGEVPEASTEAWEQVDIRWGFRRKVTETETSIEQKIYWMQTNQALAESGSVSGEFNVIVGDDEKQKFIPAGFPEGLLQDDEADLEVYAIASFREFEISSVLDFPAGMKQYLAGDIEISGDVFNQTALADGRAAAVGGASIHYINKMSGKIYQAFSDAGGGYRIFVQGYGEYLVSVLGAEMLPRTKLVTLVENPAHQISGQSISLEELPTGTSVSNNQLYDISNSALDALEGTGLRVSGVSIDVGARSAIPEFYLLFYKYPDKVYFQRSDESGSFNGLLPSADEGRVLSFYASVYGYTYVEGSLKLSEPELIEVVKFEADPNGDPSIFNNAPIDLKITEPTSDITVRLGGGATASYGFRATAEDEDGDDISYRWQIFARAGEGWSESAEDDLAGDTAATNIDFSGYNDGEYLVKVSAHDIYDEPAEAAWPGSDSKTVIVVTNQPPTGLRIVEPSGNIVVNLASGNAPQQYVFRAEATDPDDGDTLSYQWDVFLETGGGGWAASPDSTKGQTGSSVQFDFGTYAGGQYQIRVSATDRAGASAAVAAAGSNTLVVTVDANSAPSGLKIVDPAADIFLYEGGTTGMSYTFQAESTDPDGGSLLLAYTWEVFSKNVALGTWNGTATASFSQELASKDLDFSAYGEGEYEVRVSATDRAGASAAAEILGVSDRRVVTVYPVRTPQNLKIDQPTNDIAVNLSGSASQMSRLFMASATDADEAGGDTLSYTWKVFARPSGVLKTTKTGENVTMNFSAYAAGQYEVQVLVEDSTGMLGSLAYAGSNTLNLTVNPNNPPTGLRIVEPTGNIAVNLASGNAPQAYVFRAEATDPDDGDTLSYQWEVFLETGGGGWAASPDSTKGQTGSSVQFDFGTYTEGQYQIRVSATDRAGASAAVAAAGSNTRVVTINPNNAPTDLRITEPSSNNVNLYKGSTASQILDLAAVAADADGDTLRYEWQMFSKLGSDWGTGTVISTESRVLGIDFANYAAGEYKVGVSASDSFGAAAVASTAAGSFTELVVTVHANRPPTGLRIMEPSGNIAVNLASGNAPQAYVFRAEATDPDDGDTLSYQWDVFPETGGGGWAASPDSTKGQTGSSVQFDFGTYAGGQYQIRVSATDRAGASAAVAAAGSNTRVVTVDANSAPSGLKIVDPAADIFLYEGGTTGMSYTFQAEATDPDGGSLLLAYTWEVFSKNVALGTWNGTATASFSQELASKDLDFSAYGEGEYEVRVSATDRAGASAAAEILGVSDRRVVTVYPARTPQNLKIDQPTNDITVNLSGSASQMSRLFMASATDADEAGGDTLSYTWKVFARPSGVLKTTKTGENVTMNFSAYAAGQYEVQVLVEDSTGMLGSLAYAGSNTLNLTVNPNNPPTGLRIVEPTGNIAVNLASGNAPQAYVFRAEATDPDDGDTLSYQWEVFLETGGGGWAASPDSTKGQTGSSVQFDFGTYTEGQYQIRVSATDRAGASAAVQTLDSSDRVTVTVVSNSAPTDLRITEPSSNNVNLYKGSTASQILDLAAVAADADGDTLRYEWQMFSKLGSDWGTGTVISTESRVLGIDFANYAAGEYKVGVSAVDSFGAAAVASTAAGSFTELVVTVHANRPPTGLRIVEPSGNIVVNLASSDAPQAYVFRAEATDPDDGDTLSYQWDVFLETGGGGWAASPDSTKGQTGSSVQFDFGTYTEGQYQIRVSATDRAGASAAVGSNTRVVTVNANSAPSGLKIVDPAADIFLYEGGTTGMSYTFQAEATDPDAGEGDTLSYQWEVFSKNVALGTWNGTATASFSQELASKDWDFSAYGEGEYQVRVSATDRAGASAAAEIPGVSDRRVVTVYPVRTPQNLKIDQPTNDITVNLGGSALQMSKLFMASATDADEAGGDTLSYTWKVFARPSGVLKTTKTGENVTMNFSEYAAGQYEAQVLVEDSTGMPGSLAYAGSNTLNLTVNPNNPPTGLRISAPTGNIAVNLASGNAPQAYVFRAEATDPDQDDDTLSYQWEVFPQTGGGGWAASPDSTKGQTGNNVMFNFGTYTEGQYQIRVSATDRAGASAAVQTLDSSDRVTITVASNSAPSGPKIVEPVQGTLTIYYSSGTALNMIYSFVATATNLGAGGYKWELFQRSGGMSGSFNLTRTYDNADPSVDINFYGYGKGQYVVKVSAASDAGGTLGRRFNRDTMRNVYIR